MELNKLVCDAGILGAGGAGFPTHVKINCKAEFVLANGAECEPLLRVFPTPAPPKSPIFPPMHLMKMSSVSRSRV